MGIIRNTRVITKNLTLLERIHDLEKQLAILYKERSELQKTCKHPNMGQGFNGYDWVLSCMDCGFIESLDI